MSSRRFFHIFGVAAAICMASGIPTRSQDEWASTQAGAVLKAGRNVNMVSGTTLPNGDPWLQRQNEPSIAVSTRNTLHLLAGANDYRTVDMPMEGVGGELPGKDGKLAAPHDAWLGLFKSFDGGQSWTSTLLPGFPQDKTAEGKSSPLKGYRAAADPVVRAGTNGLFYYCGIAFNREKTPGRVNSVVFIARFIDNNNVEGGDSIKYLGTKIIANDDKLQWFSVDKPWIAVDVPSNSFRSVMIDGQKIPAANVYVAYSVFKEVGNVITSEIRFLRSTDCGQTWERPIVLSRGQILNQGAVVAIDPRENGHLYVAWRRFNAGKQGSAIIIAKSTNYGKTFDRVSNVATLPQFPGGPFDQPSKADTPQSQGTSFRTNSYPTVGLDNRGIVYLAWAQRGYGPAGATRVVLTTSKDGFAWTTPAAIDNPPDILGHQFMPSLAVGLGRVTLVWYDQREDFAANYMGFWDFICDNLPYRHTIDIRAAQASTADYPHLKWTNTQVSRYLFSLEQDLQDPSQYTAYQAQFNPPNYPLFQSGTLPFHGDYIDITPSPWFVRDAKGRWRFNTKSSANPLFHAAWTDNRDVRPPSNWDWVSYAPPASNQDPDYVSANRPSCTGGQQPGMRNQNIYTSRLTTGIETGSPANSKSLDLDVPRAFVMFVKNNTDIPRSFRLTIANQPLNGTASFLQFEPLDFLDVSIAPASTISRQVFVDSTDTRASVTINIEEIDAPGGPTVPNGLVSSLILNGDPTSPAVSAGEETHEPEIGNPNIRNWYVNPNVVNPNIRNADIINDDIVNPNIRNINIPNTSVVNPNIVSASLFNPNIRNADLLNPNIVNPNIRNPNIRNASPEEISVIDVEWPVKNAGNTASSFTFKVIAKEALPPGLYAQLIIYKVNYTPAVAGQELGNAGVNGCELKQEPHHEVLLNVVNPNIVNPDIVNPNIRNPNIRNAAIENATFVLEPGEEALVNLRIIQTELTQQGAFQTQDFPLPIDIQSFVESLGGAVTSQSVDSEDAAQGVTEPPADATTLIITTSSLPPGLIGSPYPVIPYTSEDARLKAVGGTEPYSWWVNPSDLPPGLGLDAATGQIFGTPTKDPNKRYPYTYRFMAQVTDAGSPRQTHSQLLSIGIEDPTVPPPPLSIITPSPLPPGTAGKPYGTTLDAAGGTWPYAWAVVSGTLPPGLVLDSGGFISGTPDAEGTYYFRIRVTDSSAPVKIDERDYTLTIQAATAPTYTISGTITIGGSGTPLSGVLLRGLPGAPTTNAAGFYTDTVPQSWSGTVIPFRAGYQFMPSERSYAGITSNQLNQDYITYSVDLDHFEIDPIGSRAAGIAFSITITAKDIYGNTVTTYNDPNTLSDTTGTISPASTGAFLNGVWAGNVTIRKAAPSVTITTGGGGKMGQSNVFSVTVGSPSAVKIEDAPDGTGTEVDTKTIGVGNHVAVYAISRDVGNNFIANVEVAWSLINKTGGCVDSDLVPATDNKSAVFTAHSAGTARISADHASLVDDTTGIITVVETQPDDAYEENDSFAAAAEISLGTHKDLVLADEDWFKVYVPAEAAGKDLKINLKGTSFPDPNARGDLDFNVLSSAGKLLSANYSGSGDETAYITNVAPGWYFIGQVYMEVPGTLYNLTAEVGDNFGIGYIEGRVTDLQGLGIEGVYVELYPEPLNWNYNFPMITTGADGHFKIGFSPGNYTVMFNLNIGYAGPLFPGVNYIGEIYSAGQVIPIIAGSTVTGIDAHLEPGGAISGRVLDPAGNPSGLAIVNVYNGNNAPVSVARADSNGYYSVLQLRTGNYKVRFRTGNTYSYEWFDNTYSFEDGLPVAVQSGLTTSGIDARLEGWASTEGFIEGRVTDTNGFPIQDVSVTAYDGTGFSWVSASTDANGSYRLRRLAPGPIRVFFNASSAGGNYVSEYYPDKATLPEAVPVPIQAGQTVYGIDAQLAAGGTITGRVTDSAGNPFQTVAVTCFAVGSDRFYSISTDLNGNYLLKGLLPGDYKVRFKPPAGSYLLEWHNNRNSFAEGDVVYVAAGATISGLDAQLAINDGGTITGRVTDGSGAGLKGVTVWVYDSDRLAGIAGVETNSGGYYTAPRIPAGDAKVFINTDLRYLRVASEYYNNRNSFEIADRVNIIQSQTTPLNDVVLAPLPSLAITTSSLPNGEVGVPYSVSLQAAGGRPFYYWSLVSGNLPDGLTFNSKGEIHGTPTVEGTFNITFRIIDSTSPTPDQQSATQSYSFTVGAYAGTGYLISGRITQGGSPLAGVVLEGFPGSPATNSNGEYVAPVSPGWSGTVTPTKAGYAFNPANRTYSTVASNFTNQDYAASPGYTISGTITLDGSPLSGVLMAGLPGSPRTNLSGFYTAAVPSGWVGTVTPSLPGFTFDPAERPYSNVVSNQAGQDYSAGHAGGQEDAYEENDDLDHAALITPGFYPDLVLNDQDWFKVSVSAADAGKDMKVRLKGISYPDPTIRRDMDFQIVSGSGKLLSYSISGGDDETAYICGLAEGLYYIGNVYTEPIGSVYSLSVEIGLQFGIGYVEGRVTNEQGNGIPDIYVELYNEPFNWDISRPLVTTDAAGNYRVGYAPGNYTVRYNLQDFYHQDPYARDVNYIGKTFNSNDVVTIVAGATVTGINVQLWPGGTISGRVTDPNGNGINFAGAYVYAADKTRLGFAWSNPNGDYYVDRLPTGNYKVRFRQINRSFADEWYENTSTFGDGLIVPAQAGSTTPNINARLEDWPDIQGFIAGRVTDGSGNPLSSVQVVAYDLAGLSVSSSSTDENGNYQVWRLPPGQYRVWFNASTASGNFASEYYADKLMLDEAVPISVESGQTAAGIDAQLAGGGTITGRVTNAQGDAYPWLNVVCFDIETDRYYAATTDVDGNYAFRNLLPDTYKIRFRPAWNYAVEWYSDKGSFAAGNPIIVGAGQTVSGINTQLLQNGGFVSGRVTDSLARGIPGVVVYVRDGVKQGVVSSVETGADGNYTVPRIPSGDVKVHFDADYYRFAVSSEYYNDKPTHAAADLVPAVLGQTTPNVNAVLGPIPALGIITTSLPSAEIGGSYNAALQATGGREFYYWSLISGTLPEGLILSSKGVISGTPTALGTSSFTVQVIDSTNPQQQDSQDYSLTVQAYSGSDYLISGTVLLGGLPLPGVSLTGLPGNPVTNAQGKYVVAVPPGWSGTVYPTLAGYAFAPASRSYSNVTSGLDNQDFTASPGHSISGTITLNGSPLQGVWLNGLLGTPRTNSGGNYIGWVADGWSGTVTPSLSGYAFSPVNRSYSNVSADQPNQDYAAYSGAALRITTNSLPGGTKNSPYSTTLRAAYGTTPYSWDITQGQLSTGLMLNTDGQISGTPTEAGDFSITIRVRDSSSPPQSVSRSFGFNISPAHQAFWTTSYPFGGSIFSQGIVFDPGNSSTIYVTPLWRGIYRSQDGGGSWTSITDDRQLPFARTNVRVLRLRSSSEFYTAGERGIFRSTDAGLNWTEIDTGITPPVTALALHPADAGTLYAGTQAGQFFKSANGGLNWQNLSGGLLGVEIRTIVIDPHDHATVYAGTLSQGLFRSSNDGPWEPVNGDLSLVRIENIVFDPSVAGTIYIAGEDGDHRHGIYRTTNAGASWTRPLEVGIRWEPGFYITIDPGNTNILYVAAGDFIHKSTNGGTSWTALPVANSGVTCVVMDPGTPTTLYAGTEDDGVLKSLNSGANWSEANTGIRGLVFPHSESHSLHIDVNNPNHIYAGSINGGYRSLNGGQTWEKMDHPDRQISSLLTHQARPGAVFTLRNRFWKSGDWGRSDTWTDPTGGSFCCSQDGDLGAAYQGQLVLYAGVTGSGSLASGVYKSLNDGLGWELMNNGLTTPEVDTLTIHPADPNTIIVGTQAGRPAGPSASSRLFRTTNGGGNWQQLTCGLPDFIDINQIVFYPGDPNILYLGAEVDNGGVYRSDDGGNCWYKVFNGNVNTIAVHPANPNVVYAGTWNAGGFYVTLDGGQTWSTLNGGLPLDPGIESMAVDPRNPYHVFIGTTAGVFETTLAFDLSITTTSFPSAIVNQAYNARIEAVGGTPPYAWEISSGSLPPGMAMDLSDGHIEGLTTAAGSFAFTVRVADNAGQTFTRRLTLNVLNEYNLNITAFPTDGGTVTKSPDQPKYLEGSVVAVSVAPKDGYLFTGWSGDASGKTPLIHVQMTQDKNITANFALLVSLPDYYVEAPGLPAAAAAGQVIGGSVSVSAGNQGATDPYPGSISVGLYLSSDPVITTSDILLWKGRSSIGALSGGGTTDVAIDPQLQIPTTISAGNYTIGVLIDEFDVIAERDEGNNTTGRAIIISSPGYGGMEITGGWPYGALYGLDIDPARNLAFVGNGGLIQVLDVSTPASPRLRSQLSLAPNCPTIIKILGTTAFIANQGGGLKVIDISDPLNLRVIGTCSTIQSARGLDVSGSHAYVADYHQGFRIIDVSNPSAPTQTAFLPFPGRTRVVKVFGNYAYVQRGQALNESQGPSGIQIIDISDPASPVLKALIPAGAGDVDLDSSGHYLFIPTSNNYLRIYDVSNPDAPFEAGVYYGARYPTAVMVVGNRAYVPDQNEQKLVILDISDPSHPFELSTYRFTTPVSLWIPRVVGNLCYISSWYDSLRIVDFSNLAMPREVGVYDAVGLLNYADISDNHVYLANSKVTQSRMKVLSLSGLPDITETATLNTPYPIYDLITSGHHAYLAAYTSGLRSIDISNPLNPTEVGSCEALSQASDVAISGNFAFVADGSNGLRIVDISTPSSPILRSTLGTEGAVYQVSLSGKYAYLAAASGGLRIIDISDPLNPWEVGSFKFDGEAYNVNVSGDYAYVNDNYLRLRIINVSDPNNPVEVSTFGLYYSYGDIGISGSYLIVPDWIWGVRVLDVSNPSSPVEVAVLRELFSPEEVVVREHRIYVVNRDTGFYVLEFRPLSP